MVRKFDFLVIGSGIAGMSFALKVAHKGKVALICKSGLEEANTYFAQGGVASVTNLLVDNFDKHIEDTMIAGDWISDREAVEKVVREAPAQIEELIKWGVDFDKNEKGEFDLHREGGHSEFRILHHKDNTGAEIQDSLIKAVQRHPNIEVIENQFAVEILTQHHLGVTVTRQTPDIKCYGAYILDPKTGKVLACVSYPGYDNNRLSNVMDTDYYVQLSTGLSRTFYNRATQEKTAPGSTYKMMSSVAGLTEGVIGGGTYLPCTGEFDKITPSPKCWIYPSAHGSLNVVGAIQHSCNDFFYEVGYRLGQDENGNYDSSVGLEKLEKYASMFGLDETSGVEIPESDPQISDTDAVRSAIGQGTNNYTVSQLNRYVTAVANRGTVYKLSLVGKTTDADGKLIKEYEPEVVNQMDEVSSSTWDLVHNGMESMVKNSSVFSKMEIAMGGKTGTAQQSKVHPDHVLFAGYAPADDPQIAITVRIANGYSSNYAAEIGRDITKVYFDANAAKDLITGKASSLGKAGSGD